MEQILVLGNEETRSWSSNIPKSFFLQMPSYSLSEDGENNLMEFIIQNLPLLEQQNQLFTFIPQKKQNYL